MKKWMILLTAILLTVTIFIAGATTFYAEPAGNTAHKYSLALAKKLAELDSSDFLCLGVWLAYPAKVDYEFSQEDFVNERDYIAAKRAADKEYYLEKNQEYFSQIDGIADVELTYLSKFTPSVTLYTTASEVVKIASLEAVSYIDLLDVDPLPSPTEDSSYLYKERFAKWIDLPEYDSEIHGWDFGTYSDYEELFYHYSTLGMPPDWVLIKAHVEMYSPWELVEYKEIGDHVLVSWCPGASGLVYELAVYDAQQDAFFDINHVSPDDYTGLAEAIDTLDLGYRYGDADMDGEVDILDATVIQRCEANLETPVKRAYRQASAAISDFNRDGDRDILDATCIQRYMAEMSYPKNQ